MTHLIQPPSLWLVPSFYGDIRLTSTSPKTCLLVAEKLTVRETEALRLLEPKARSKGWIGPSVSFSEGEFEIAAPISRISQALAKALKPERTIVSAVKFANGTIEEVTTASFEDEKSPGNPGTDSAIELPVTKKAVEPRDSRDGSAPESSVYSIGGGAAAAPVVGTSVAAPVRGCVSPEFLKAELKARMVLEHFLGDDQIEDFRRYNRFISVGVDTGHRYMIASRHAGHEHHASFRSLYDLDDDRALCVHDWAVPASEEMLGLHVLLQLPGWELYVRQDEHDHELALLEARSVVYEPG